MTKANARKLLNNMPEERRIFIKKYADFVVLLNSILKDNKTSKKELAEKLDKTAPEISKWMNGEHNFTFMTVCKLEAVLGVDLITIPNNKVVNSDGKKVTMIVHKNEIPHISKDTFSGNVKSEPKRKNKDNSMRKAI